MFYINAIHGGGAERVILQLAHRFSMAGYRSILVTSFIDREFEYPVPEGVERISIEEDELHQSRLKKNVSRIRKLRDLCKEYRPAALVSFMAEPNFRAICATVGLAVKNIVSVRNDPNREYAGKLGKVIGKWLLPWADGCVFQTEDAKAWFPMRLQKKSAVIMNEVSQAFFETQYEDGKNVVALGRLCEQKNHAVLIDAYSKIAKDFPDRRLEIYGSGNLQQALQSQIESLGMEEYIKLMGATSDVPSVLAHAKCFVMSSDYEGMPNALMEALTVGVPSICTDCPCGGPKMLIRNNENGILVPVNDAEALAEAIRLVLSDDSFAKRLSAEAKNCSAEYRPEVVFEKWKNFVEGTVFG